MLSSQPAAPVPLVPGERMTARQILLAAATAVAKAPSDGAYWRTRTVSGQRYVDPEGRYVILRGSSREQWPARRPGGQSWWIDQNLGAKPATPQDEAAWRAAGSPDVKQVKRAPDEPVGARLKGVEGLGRAPRADRHDLPVPPGPGRCGPPEVCGLRPETPGRRMECPHPCPHLPAIHAHHDFSHYPANFSRFHD
ncbi:hypothetical protein [Microtetraspora niveoalba]|uniref:hypothetical protein n=1 Tax=Microtetraspora niveoalba TaxID=46175 RepID=UPI00082D8EE1|nr:hypothetical protein [Microtetraspora niveoalba]